MNDRSRPVDKKRRSVIVIFLAALVLIGLPVLFVYRGLGSGASEDFMEDHRFLMDTVVTLKVYGIEDPDLLEGAFDLMARYESLISRHKRNSDSARINAAAAGQTVPVSPETMEVLEAALHYAELSGGAFDPTVGPLVDLWGIGNENARRPAAGEIEGALSLVDWRSVILSKGSVGLERPGMAVDLGAVGKGWIADRIGDHLNEAGAAHVLVDLGGNILARGGKPDGSPFRIGMQNPFESRGRYLGVFTVRTRSLTSSGNYERYFEVDGVRYHHILDTETGHPVRNDLAAVTVLSEHSVDGDALSTTLFALGLEEGLKLIRTLEGAEAAFVSLDGTITMTAGARKFYEPADTSFPVIVR